MGFLVSDDYLVMIAALHPQWPKSESRWLHVQVRLKDLGELNHVVPTVAEAVVEVMMRDGVMVDSRRLFVAIMMVLSGEHGLHVAGVSDVVGAWGVLERVVARDPGLEGRLMPVLAPVREEVRVHLESGEGMLFWAAQEVMREG